MQEQKSQSVMKNETLATGPVEIDAQLLQFVGGGAPKNTWGEEPSAAAAVSVDEEDPAPKNTW